MKTLLTSKKFTPEQEKVLSESDFSVSFIPFISIFPISQAKKNFKEYTLFVFTSENAVTHFTFEGISENVSFAAISGNTSLMLEKKIKRSPVFVGKNAHELAKNIVSSCSKLEKILFVSATKRRDELPKVLIENGYTFSEHSVYETKILAPRVNTLFDYYVFFSPSSVESFFKKNVLPQKATLIVIGATTEIALKQKTTLQIQKPNYPSRNSIVELLCEKKITKTPMNFKNS